MNSRIEMCFAVSCNMRSTSSGCNERPLERAARPSEAGGAPWRRSFPKASRRLVSAREQLRVRVVGHDRHSWLHCPFSHTKDLELVGHLGEHAAVLALVLEDQAEPGTGRRRWRTTRRPRCSYEASAVPLRSPCVSNIWSTMVSTSRSGPGRDSWLNSRLRSEPKNGSLIGMAPSSACAVHAG